MARVAASCGDKVLDGADDRGVAVTKILIFSSALARTRKNSWVCVFFLKNDEVVFFVLKKIVCRAMVV